MRFQRTVLAASSIALVFGAAACSSSDDGAATPAASEVSADAPATDAPAAETPAGADNAVTIAGSRFEPTELSVAAGTTVSFTNTDPFAHTVTSKDDAPMAFDSGNLDGDQPFEVTFADAGTYNYFCQIHPTMRASIVVT